MQGLLSLPFSLLIRKEEGPRFHFQDNDEMYPFELGLCSKSSSIWHVRMWTRVCIIMCPMQLDIGHKLFPSFLTFNLLLFLKHNLMVTWPNTTFVIIIIIIFPFLIGGQIPLEQLKYSILLARVGWAKYIVSTVLFWVHLETATWLVALKDLLYNWLYVSFPKINFVFNFGR